MKATSILYTTDNVPWLGNLADAILVYVQWVSATPMDDLCDMYFDQIKADCWMNRYWYLQMGPAWGGMKYVPVSTLMSGWVFTGVREHLCEWSWLVVGGWVVGASSAGVSLPLSPSHRWEAHD